MQDQGWNPGGRSAGWRLGMAVAGGLVAGAGVALFLWPWLLIWLLSGLLVLVGLFLVVSALAARGPGAPRSSEGPPTDAAR